MSTESSEIAVEMKQGMEAAAGAVEAAVEAVEAAAEATTDAVEEVAGVAEAAAGAAVGAASGLFGTCLGKLQTLLSDVPIDTATIMSVVKYAMEIVELTQLKGPEQRELATGLIRQIIVDAPVSDTEEKLLLDMVDHGVVGNTIDLIADASKGRLEVNAVAEVAVGCCAAFLSSQKSLKRQNAR